MVYPITKITIFSFVRRFIKELKGIENIPEKGPFIIAANQSSSLDQLFIVSLIIPKLNKKIHSIAKVTAYWKFFGDKICEKWAGCLLMDEKNKSEVLERALRILKEEGVILIFPEGTRNKELTKAKTGVARLALRSKVPVLPIGIDGTHEMLPKGGFIPRFTRKAKISIGKPMAFEKYYGQENDYLILRTVTTKIMKEIARLAKKEYKFN